SEQRAVCQIPHLNVLSPAPATGNMRAGCEDPLPSPRITVQAAQGAPVTEDEDRWDEAADPQLDVVGGIDGMKRLTPSSTWWHTLPHRENALNGARGGGQPWTMLASTCTRRKARFASSPRRGG